MCQLGLYRLRFIGFQDLFTISRETRFFFIVTYGLSTVVMCYVGGKYVYIDVERTAHRQGLLFAQLRDIQDTVHHTFLRDAKERAAVYRYGMHSLSGVITGCPNTYYIAVPLSIGKQCEACP